jgi:toxin ParE1/3/4
MTVRWSRQAIRDLRGIREYIARDDATSAAAMNARLRNAAELLVDYPHIGRVGELAGTHDLIVPRTPYIVVYRLRGDVAEILRVRHGAQNWPPQG